MEARRGKSETGFGDSRYLGVFKEIIRDPVWQEHFDLAFRPSFNDVLEHIQNKLGKGIAVGVS